MEAGACHFDKLEVGPKKLESGCKVIDGAVCDPSSSSYTLPPSGTQSHETSKKIYTVMKR